MAEKDIQNILNEALEYGKTFLKNGEVAKYIPELAKANIDSLCACIKTVNGKTYYAGNCNEIFTIQSISKTISLIYALELFSYDYVFSKVGFEQTSDPFNSLLKLENRSIYPLNPLINAGAIVISGMISKKSNFEKFLDLVKKVCKRDTIDLNEKVFLSEKSTGSKNKAIAYLLDSNNVLESSVEDSLDLYFKMCSININTEDLANFGVILANNGLDPDTGKKIIDGWIVKIVKTIMLTCGMYDASGEFAVRVGMPAKSGVGGGIVSLVENQMGIAVFGPSLNDKGNSIGGYHILEYISQKLNLHYFSEEKFNLQ